MTRLNLFFFGEEQIHIEDALWFYALPVVWGIGTLVLIFICKV